MRATGRGRGAKAAPTSHSHLGLEAELTLVETDGGARACRVVSSRVVGANERVRYGQAKYSSKVPLPDRPAAGDGDSSLA